MAVIKRVQEKQKGCKGEHNEVCSITHGVELDDFIFDKCNTCSGVFNYKKITGEVAVVIKKERTMKKVKPKAKYKQEKLF